MRKPNNTLGVRSLRSKGCDAGPRPNHPLGVLSESRAQIADLSGNQKINSWADQGTPRRVCAELNI